MGMSQLPKKQKGADELGKEEQTYGTSSQERDSGSPKVPDIRNPDARANLGRNPGTMESTVSQTAEDGDSDTKESPTKFENGFVDGPAGRRDESDIQADAKRDASPGQASNVIKGGRSRDARSSV